MSYGELLREFHQNQRVLKWYIFFWWVMGLNIQQQPQIALLNESVPNAPDSLERLAFFILLTTKCTIQEHGKILSFLNLNQTENLMYHGQEGKYI